MLWRKLPWSLWLCVCGLRLVIVGGCCRRRRGSWWWCGVLLLCLFVCGLWLVGLLLLLVVCLFVCLLCVVGLFFVFQEHDDDKVVLFDGVMGEVLCVV